MNVCVSVVYICRYTIKFCIPVFCILCLSFKYVYQYSIMYVNHIYTSIVDMCVSFSICMCMFKSVYISFCMFNTVYKFLYMYAYH